MGTIRINVRCHRRGVIAVLSAVMLILMFGVVAFAVDIGYLLKIKTELQRAADASALAACWEFTHAEPLASTASTTTTLEGVRTVAAQYSLSNLVGNASPTVDTNSSNVESGDVVLGYISNPTNPASAMTYSSPSNFNAVLVRVQESTTRNGSVPFFFGHLFGVNGIDMEAKATAALIRNIKGFRTPADGSNLGILPFALDEDTWNALTAGHATDSWTWNSSSSSAQGGSDGIQEVNLYPQGTGSPGNRGTVDIGSSNNSTADIARQIVDGVSPTDMAKMGGELKFNSQGTLSLNGDTGISAGVKDELASIIGQPRMIPIFRSVSGPGNNATYTIVKFAGVRIVHVKLTGSDKQVMIQPANFVAKGIIASDTEGMTDFIFSTPYLVR